MSCCPVATWTETQFHEIHVLYHWLRNTLYVPFRLKRLSLAPPAISTIWCELNPALKRLLLMRWLRRRRFSFLELLIRSSSSSMGRFMNASLVGAKMVQGPAEKK